MSNEPIIGPSPPDGAGAAVHVIRARHEAWVEAHLREHQLLDVAWKHVDAERDKRYSERFISGEKAVNAAGMASKEAVHAALASAKEAINKSEVAVEKRADAVYVTLQKMTDALAALMPRAEAESRFANQAAAITAALSRLDRIESKQGPLLESEKWMVNHEDRITNVGSRLTNIEAKAGGMGSLASSAAVGISVLVAVISLIFSALRA